MPGDPRRSRCTLIFQAPEELLDDEHGPETDIPSLGCTVFQLVVGYSPFAGLWPKKDNLVRNWISTFGDLPQKWKQHTPPPNDDYDPVSLPDWLHDTYFDEGKEVEFAEAHIEELGELSQWILQYPPSDRPSISEVSKHPWLAKNPVALSISI
ncbi:MAG: hypothetical protein Q9170_001498 [Blastenia crenularia]